MDKQLNTKLYHELFKENIDYDLIIKLLKEGADPLGPLEDDEESCVLEELIWESYDEDSEIGMYWKLPKLVNIFIENGMDPKRIKVNEDNPSPVWALAHICSRNALLVLKTLIENDLSKECVNDFIEHFIEDTTCVYCNHLETPEDYYSVNYGYKMIMLCASYENIIEDNELLKHLIDYDNNNFDLTKFREYDEYSILIDTSTCTKPNDTLAYATISIKDMATEEIVRKFIT